MVQKNAGPVILTVTTSIVLQEGDDAALISARLLDQVCPTILVMDGVELEEIDEHTACPRTWSGSWMVSGSAGSPDVDLTEETRVETVFEHSEEE